MPTLVLASQSTYRRDLLSRLGVAFETVPADVDESRLSDEAPRAMARRLARCKAEHVGAARSNAFVLGSDQVIALGDEIFSKPGTRARAVEQLARLQGHVHELVTAVALVTPDGDVVQDEVVFEMEMRPLGTRGIEEYVDLDRPFDCAGSYKVEAAGIRLFASMRGPDYTAIVGLPLTRVWTMLETSGYFEEAS